MPRPHSSEASSVAARQGKEHRCCGRWKRRSCGRKDCRGGGDRWANPARSWDDGYQRDQPPSHPSRIADELCIAPCCGPRNKEMPRPHSSEASSVAALQGKAHRCCDRPQRRSCRRRDCTGRGDWWANSDRNLDGSVRAVQHMQRSPLSPSFTVVQITHLRFGGTRCNGDIPDGRNHRFCMHTGSATGKAFLRTPVRHAFLRLSDAAGTEVQLPMHNLIDLLGVNLHFRIIYTQNGV